MARIAAERPINYTAIMATQVHDWDSLCDSTNVGSGGSHSKLILKLEPTVSSVDYKLGMKEKTVIDVNPKIWSEPLESWHGHKTEMGKTAEKASLHKGCLFLSSGCTDFQALIMNPVGDVEYEVR